MTITSGLTTALAGLPAGAKAVYSGLSGAQHGPSSSLQERLGAMGFVSGTELKVEANHGRGPVIVKIRGARVALGRGQAQQMLVRELLCAADSESVVSEHPLSAGGK